MILEPNLVAQLRNWATPKQEAAQLRRRTLDSICTFAADLEAHQHPPPIVELIAESNHRARSRLSSLFFLSSSSFFNRSCNAL
jgi:hypothetical protein